MAAGYQESDAVREARDLVAELCRHFYTLGWVSGTGGSISIKVNEPGKTNQERTIVMAPSAADGTVLVEPTVELVFSFSPPYHPCHSCTPHPHTPTGVKKERTIPEDMYSQPSPPFPPLSSSPSTGVQKERMLPEDMYVMAPDGTVLVGPMLLPCSPIAYPCTHTQTGVQKERMLPEDMYVMAPDGTVLVEPKVKPHFSFCSPRAEGENDTRGHVRDGPGRHSAGGTNSRALFFIHPSTGVQKERMIPEDMYVMAPDGTVLVEPTVEPSSSSIPPQACRRSYLLLLPS
ncbi:unnamed protein product [Closterium sp. NIES-53]